MTRRSSSDLTGLYPENIRNSQIEDLKYDRERLEKASVLIIGANEASEQIIRQLLVLGFTEVYLWGPESDVNSAESIMKRNKHLSPYYRHSTGWDNRAYGSLEAKANASHFDDTGFSLMHKIDPQIVINTINNPAVSDALLGRYLKMPVQGLFIDAHTINDNGSRLYGLNIQTSLNARYSQVDNFSQIEFERDLGLFDDCRHDPLMTILAASIVSSHALRFILDPKSTDPLGYFGKPTSFNLFPFTDSPFDVQQAQVPLAYPGFFSDKNIYLAGLGGGSLLADILLTIFDVENLIGVDKDKLERTNFNRILPLADERLIGMTKAKAAETVYRQIAGRPGRNIRFKEGVIFNDLCVEQPENLDLAFGFLSGVDNKMNLSILTQNLGIPLFDVGVEPFRSDVLLFNPGVAPCDYCRNFRDKAIIDYFAMHTPNCDIFPQGSTVFSNYLGAAIAVIQAMKHFNPALGQAATDSVTSRLLWPSFDQSKIYEVKNASHLDLSMCSGHRATSPLLIEKADYTVRDGFDGNGWNMKTVYQNSERRQVGTFRYIPI